MRLALIRLITLCLPAITACLAQAQSGVSKDATFAFYFGIGAEWLPEAYSPRGFSMNVTGRYYTSERLFLDMLGHWGNNEGSKDVTQGNNTTTLRDERNSLLIAAGPGYDLYQNGENTLSIHARMLIGYGLRHSEYDDFDPHYGDNGRFSHDIENTRNGFAAVGGVGVDMRFKRWIITPSVDAIYVGNAWSVSATLSVGYFY